MKKFLLTTALGLVIASPSLATENVPYSQQRSISQADVATLAPAAGDETPKDAAEAILAEPAESDTPAAEPAVNVEPPLAAAEAAPVEAVSQQQTPEPHWGYGTGAMGSDGWGDVSAEFTTCKTGTKQSPINISKFYQEDLPNIEPLYNEVPLSVVNNGRTLEFNYAPGSGFKIDGLGYRLQKFIFHTPSEHYMDGAPYPMELQFVHQADDGSWAIVAVMIKAGEHNKFIEALWQNAPANTGGEKTIEDVKLSATDLMPSSLDYYRYDGSLTMPPCTEGVQWMVLKEPIEASEEQIKTFQKLFPTNARPVQPLGDRVVTGD